MTETKHNPAHICADCGDELTFIPAYPPFCKACWDQHEAARRVAEEERTQTEPAPPMEEERCGRCDKPFDAYRRVNPSYSSDPAVCSEGAWAWACEQLLAGRKVRRKSWVSGAFVRLKINELVDRNGGLERLFRSWLNATDWELYEEPTSEPNDYGDEVSVRRIALEKNKSELTFIPAYPPFCKTCWDEQEAARLVAEAEQQAELELCPECTEPFDAYKRKCANRPWCIHCDEELTAETLAGVGEHRVPKVYDEPPPTPLRMTSAARWHCNNTSVSSNNDE